MRLLEVVDAETVLAGEGDWITPEVAAVLAEHPLDCVETEFPHAVWSVDGPEETVRPAEDHPVFYGCYDWHSAVHSHWSLVRQLRLIDAHPDESAILAGLDRRLTPENVADEVAHLESNPTFEKPYGWGWLLRLAAELHLWSDHRADRYRDALRPLEEQVLERVEDGFLPQDRPFRVGTHHNTAFALGCVLDYARVTANDSLATAATEAARAFFLDDTDAPVEYEPLGWDFLSPSLVEADLLRRVLDSEAFVAWLDGFLPDLTTPPQDSALRPVEVDTDSEEGVALHLVGLNLSKAWCLAGIAATLADHRYREPLEAAALRHVEYSLEEAFVEEYAGSHWLSTFVLYLLTRNAGGIAPG